MDSTTFSIEVQILIIQIVIKMICDEESSSFAKWFISQKDSILQIVIKMICDEEFNSFIKWLISERVSMIKRIDKQLKRFPRVSSFITSEEIFNHVFIQIRCTLKKKKIGKNSKKLRTLIENYEAYFIQSVNFHLYKLNHRLKVHVDLSSKLQRFSEPFHVDQDIASLDDNLLVQALSTLKSKNPVHHKVFLLKALEDIDYPEIAQNLNLSTDNVRQIYCRAKGQLRDFLLDSQRA